MTDLSPAAEPDLAAVLERAAGGESFAAIRRSITPPAWTPVLARAAAAERFDAEVYDNLLLAARTEPDLATLAGIGLVEPVPGRAGWYRMPPDDGALWSAELPDDERIALAAALAEAHLRRGDDLEALRHLVLADPRRGIELLDRLFDAADQAMDLPRCRDILRAVQPEGRSLGSAVADVLADRTAYLNARTLWLPDHYQSALFLGQPGLAKRSADLIAGRTRVWQLAAQGGLGKTMLVRWLLARRWVPRPRRVPCARVDYDSVDAVMCARYPFLTLLLVAEQLAPQLPRNPFSTLLRSYEPFLALARLDSRGRDDIDPAEARAADAAVPDLFVEACRAVGDRPMVIVLDTLEELSLRYPEETAVLVHRLATLADKDKAPGLRLVFAGRYAVPAVRRSFPGVIDIAVPPFTEQRAETYLRRVRGIADAERRRDLVRRAQGVPFVLALYADLVGHDPGIVLDEVTDRDPQLVYLVDRVVDRIREPLVRWLIRYGCVPRRLTLDYVLDVLAPFVVRGASGDHSLDDPMLDAIVEWYGRRLFPTDLGELQTRLERAWQDLERYVSTSSWITPAPGEPGVRTYVLKAEVLAPLRAILADRPVLRELHRESARHYLSRASDDPSRRNRHLRDVVYHVAQAGDGDLPQRWRQIVDDLRDGGDHTGLDDLCAEFTRSEYIDDRGRPLLRRDGSPLVPEPLLLEARLWRAYAAVAVTLRAAASGDEPRLGRAHLVSDRIADEITGLDAARRAVVRSAADIVRSADRLSRGHLDREVVRDLWEHSVGDIARTAGFLWILTLRRNGDDDTSALQEVTRQALDDRYPADATLTCGALADRLVDAGDVAAAIGWVRRTAEAGGSLWDRYLELLTLAGRPDAALAAGAPESPAQQRGQAQALLALRRPAEALKLLRTCTDSLDASTLDTASRLRERAECLSVQGQVLAAMLRLDDAASCFEEATELWKELGHPHGQLRTVRRHAETLLRDAGDVHSARLLLEGSRPQPDSPDSVRIQLLLAEARSRGGDPWSEPDLRTASPRQQAVAALAVIIATGQVGRHAPALLWSTANLRPPTATLRLLEDLRWAAPGSQPAAVQPLLDFVRADLGGSSQTQGVRELQRAYVLRAFDSDRSDEIGRLVERAAQTSPSSFLAWEIVRFLGADAPDPVFDAVRADPPEQVPSAVLLLRTAERALRRGDLGTADGLAREAIQVFERTASRSWWLARALDLRASISTARGDGDAARRFTGQASARYQRLGIARSTGDDSFAAARLPTGRNEVMVAESLLPAAIRKRLRDSGPPAPAKVLADAFASSGNRVTAPLPEDVTLRVESVNPQALAQHWESIAARVYRSVPAEVSIARDRLWLRSLLSGRGSPLPEGLRTTAAGLLDRGLLLSPTLREDLERASSAPLQSRRLVLVVKASRDAERSWGYSSAEHGLDLQDSYRRMGWETRVEVPPTSIGSVALKLGVPLVIHIQARLEAGGGYGWFDMASENYEVRGGTKSAGRRSGVFDTDIIRWLYEIQDAAPPASPPPVVVLDPVVPPQFGDMASLLTVRNRLAANVYYDGPTMAVVAAGLVATGSPARVQESWLAGLQAGRSLLDVAREMQEFADPRAPVALFGPSATFTVTG
jgi:tetratricopeptide (TPR) repeat protein